MIGRKNMTPCWRENDLDSFGQTTYQFGYNAMLRPALF
jgi:hypothetical protein